MDLVGPLVVNKPSSCEGVNGPPIRWQVECFKERAEKGKKKKDPPTSRFYSTFYDVPSKIMVEEESVLYLFKKKTMNVILSVRLHSRMTTRENNSVHDNQCEVLKDYVHFKEIRDLYAK